ncbi:MAG: hypothetical protein EZS28_044924 [Streblomastix strix]|uniref:Uncharacterized protein n=1 Tax=Streblomastix strix TaxID=222440 RepID=A0A5J4TNI9_9EUKA|nr:MAG: hypothetical protein EZS28_044924 [Streblomastix strix]
MMLYIIPRDMKIIIQINCYEKDCRSSGTFFSYFLNIVIRIPIKTVVKNMNANRMKKIISIVLDGKQKDGQKWSLMKLIQTKNSKIRINNLMHDTSECFKGYQKPKNI